MITVAVWPEYGQSIMTGKLWFILVNPLNSRNAVANDIEHHLGHHARHAIK
jgi:hypothetical protein